jgi:DNA (cytosine-5)-methyltransferase 1
MPPSERRNILKNLSWYKKEFERLSDSEISQQLDYARLKCERARMSHIYKRLDADQPAYTVTGSGGGGTHVYHWEEHRALTNRERARLQGFPDKFEFQGSKEQVRKQIGMAVPPTGAKIIVEAILKTFAGIKYKYVEPSVNF